MHLTLICATLVTLAAAQSNDTNLFDLRLCTNLTVTAGQPLLVKALYNTTQGSGSGWDGVSVYLAKAYTAEDSVLNPVCTLIDCLPVYAKDATDISVTISPEWCPDGNHCDLAASLYQPSNNFTSYVYTNGWNTFNLTGADGTYYSFESDPREGDYGHDYPFGLQLWPCSAYDCVRQCIDESYSQFPPDSLPDYTPVIDCVNQNCPAASSTVNHCGSGSSGTATAPSSTTTATNFVPDGCITYDAYAFPAAAASASASRAASYSSALATVTAASPRTSTNVAGVPNSLRTQHVPWTMTFQPVLALWLLY